MPADPDTPTASDANLDSTPTSSAKTSGVSLASAKISLDTEPEPDPDSPGPDDKPDEEEQPKIHRKGAHYTYHGITLFTEGIVYTLPYTFAIIPFLLLPYHSPFTLYHSITLTLQFTLTLTLFKLTLTLKWG